MCVIRAEHFAGFLDRIPVLRAELSQPFELLPMPLGRDAIPGHNVCGFGEVKDCLRLGNNSLGVFSHLGNHPNVAPMPFHFSMLGVENDQAHIPPRPVAMPRCVGIRGSKGAEGFDGDAGVLLHR